MSTTGRQQHVAVPHQTSDLCEYTRKIHQVPPSYACLDIKAARFLHTREHYLLLAAAGVVSVPLSLSHARVLLLRPAGGQLGGIGVLGGLLSLGMGV